MILLKLSPTFWLTCLLNVQIAFIAVGCILFLMIPKALRQNYKYLGAFLFVVLTTEVSGMVGFHLLHLDMNLDINVMEFFLFFSLMLLYRDQIQRKHITVIIYVVIALHTIFGLIDFFFIQGIHGFNSYTWIMTGVCVVLASFYYFYFLNKNLPLHVEMKNVPMFWVNIAMLMYFSGTLFLYINADYLINVLHSNFIVPSYFQHSLGLVFYAMIWYALWMIKKTDKVPV